MNDPRDLTAAFDPERFMTYVGQVGHAGALGIFYRDKGEDWVELGLPYTGKLVGMPDSGIIASGPMISLMDMATSLAIWIKLGKFRHQVTLDLRVDYLRPARPGETITGRGICYGLTKSIGFVRGVAHDGEIDDPVANVTGTFMFTD